MRKGAILVRTVDPACGERGAVELLVNLETRGRRGTIESTADGEYIFGKGVKRLD